MSVNRASAVRSALSAATVAITTCAASGGAHAAFEDPASATWGGWNRGDAATVYQFWDIFGDDDGNPPFPGGSLPPNPPNPITDATPDTSFGPAGTNAITETGGRAFLTPNIYSFAFPTTFEMDIAGFGDTGSPVRVALQIRTLGTELDATSVLLDGTAPTTQTELSRTSSIFNGQPSDIVDTLFLWTLSEGQSNYAFSFAASGSSMSLDQVAVDVAPVPLPAPLALMAAGVAALSASRRREG